MNTIREKESSRVFCWIKIKKGVDFMGFVMSLSKGEWWRLKQIFNRVYVKMYRKIYTSVLIKDVIERNNIRDAALLESILKFIAANIGNIVSTKKISDYLTSSGRKTTSDTIDNYLRMLEKAFIIYKANRYDLKGKKFLKTLEKYYIVDIGICNKLTGLRDTDYGHVLENIVYLELLNRGYKVTIGKIGPLEVDFVATKTNEKIYYQVSATIMNEETRKRELKSLKKIDDNYPKYVLTMDKNIFTDYSGIKVKNIIDFLLD